MTAAYSVTNLTSATIRALNYAPEVDRLRRGARVGGWDQRPLGSLVADLGKAYAKVLTRVDCASEFGDELLSQVDIFAAEPSGRVIRGDLMRFVEDLRIRRGDVLIAGAGQMGESTLFGRAIIADARLSGKLAAGDVMVLRFDDPQSDLALYVYAYLLSAAGLRGIRSCAYGTSIPRMRPDLLGALPVPIPDEGTRARIAALIRQCSSQRERYQNEFRIARQQIEAIPEMSVAHEMCAERKARCVIWRDDLPTLTGWTYASAGGALAYLRHSWKLRLGDVLEPNGLFYGLLRQRTPCAPGHGVPMISQRDVLSIRPVPAWIANPRVSRRALFSEPYSLVMAGVGGVGDGHAFARPAFLTPALARFGLTQHLLRILPRKEYASVVDAYLSTLVGRRLLRTAAAGTVLLQLRVDLIEKLPFPALSAHQLSLVQHHHGEAVAAFDAALEAESEAIRIIEEEVLPAWLA